LVRSIERWALRRSAKIVATCEAEKEWIEAYLGKRCPKVEVTDVKRFFDLNHVDHVEHVEGQALHLLYLGRRHPLKGLEYLEAAVAELNDGSRSRESKLNSGIGNFSNVEGLSVHCSTSTSNFDSKQIELKIVSNAFGEEKEKVWDWCDVLVLPTLSENFGLVVAEALERGKRVITTDGAPVWGGESGGVECRYGGRLLYLNGYRDGSEEERVELLKKAILAAKNAKDV
jgi:glycosyltransferase involved in cell wall biosynthesis